MLEKRYRLICVAPEVPDAGSYDDLDEAIFMSDAHHEVYDTQALGNENPWVGAYCREDYEAAAKRWLEKEQASADG